jgi:hypothetical protein
MRAHFKGLRHRLQLIVRRISAFSLFFGQKLPNCICLKIITVLAGTQKKDGIDFGVY